MYRMLDMQCVEVFRNDNYHKLLKLELLLSIVRDDFVCLNATSFVLVLALFSTSLPLIAIASTIADLIFRAYVQDPLQDEFHTGHKVQDNHHCKEVGLVVQAPPHL